MSHFNDQAETWDEPKKVQMMRTLAARTIDALQARGILANTKHIVDVGCGTGLFGLEFADFAHTLTGVDSSEGMLTVFNRKTTGEDWIHSVLLDIEHVDLGLSADLFVSSMAFHHLSDPAAMVQKLKSGLNSSGALVIVDLDAEDGTFHPDNEGMGVKHFGFSKKMVKAWAVESDMALHYEVIHELNKNGRTYPIFLAVLQ